MSDLPEDGVWKLTNSTLDLIVSEVVVLAKGQ